MKRPIYEQSIRKEETVSLIGFDYVGMSITVAFETRVLM